MANNHWNAVGTLFAERKFKVVAEIGVFSGALSNYLLENYSCIEEYCAVDPWVPYSEGGGTLKRLGVAKWEELHNNFQKNCLCYPSCKEMRMASLEAAATFTPEYFDFVFIDASHSFRNVMADIEAWLPLVKKGGVLAGHDYQRKYQSVKNAVLQCFGADGFRVLPGRSACWAKEV